MDNKLYPELPEEKILYDKDMIDKVNKNLSDARIKEIQGKRQEMEKSLKHYKKILKRWKRIENFLKITSIVIVGGTAITSMVLGFSTFTLPIVYAVLAGVGATEGIISEALVLGVVKKKTAKFKKKVEHIQEYISKSWFLFEKIREDSVIMLDEVNESRKLMENYEKGVTASETDTTDDFLKLRESLKKYAEKEAKKRGKSGFKK